MTLTAAAFYPWVQYQPINGKTEEIILVSDSRITYEPTGGSMDIANKIRQVAGNCAIGYAGSVGLSLAAISKIEKKLSDKNDWKGSMNVANFFRNVVLNLRKHDKRYEDAQADFLMAITNEDNKIILYVLRHVLNYEPMLIDPRKDPIVVIGENFQQQTKLKEYVKLNEVELNPTESGKYAIVLKKSFEDYIDQTETKTVNDPVQIVSLKMSGNGGSISFVNHMKITPEGNMTKTLVEEGIWRKFDNDTLVKETSNDPLKDFWKER